MYVITNEKGGERKKDVELKRIEENVKQHKDMKVKTMILDENENDNNNGEIVIFFDNTNWDKSLSTGIDNLDKQHKEIFKYANKLFYDMEQEEGKKEIIKSLDLLEESLLKHFIEEESIQKQNQYHNYGLVHKEHEEFKNQINDLRRVIEKDELSTTFVVEIQQEMLTSYRRHVINLDKDFGEFLMRKIRK
jgi:hemerythrin